MILGTAASYNSSNSSHLDVSQIAISNISNDVGAATTTKLAIINFDDGYKSQFTSAKPILDNYGYKATLLSAIL
jgi:peptidoglycan/xylan/chitin deacetylase (PgdA/CDA1 family)